MENLYYIGNITSTHKLAGTIKLNTSFYIIEELLEMEVLAISKENIKILTIANVKGYNGKKALIDFKEIKDINLAKELVNYKLYIRKDLVPDYVEEESIIDYKVYENNEYLGNVTDLLETAGHDILVIENNEKEILIPYIDVFVKNIDDDNKVINVELIEGMR